jgi:cysteinyl-tRNA synthetase
MAIVLYNTLAREKQVFEPLDPERVTMYLCGPTVYNYAHIGNARPAVIFGLLVRLLKLHYPRVIFARNITDVDDKINQAAAEMGGEISDISNRFMQAYHEDMAGIGVIPPDVEPRATEHITEIIDMITRLIEAGHAYEAEGHVLFNVGSFADYGRLSRRDMREMIAGARVEIAPYKKHPGDFVLWKPSSADQPGWDSPWGNGRPGWHIECSVMAEKHLGDTIDIHAGGQDLIFPHHENETAQSVCAHGGKPFARYWLHNGFVTVKKQKMSKSLGNTTTLRELLVDWPSETLRYVLLSAHYRQPLDWSDETLGQTNRTLDRLYSTVAQLRQRLGSLDAAAEPSTEFLAALEDDLNTPIALAWINQLARRAVRAEEDEKAAKLGGELLACADLLGLLQMDPQAWVTGRSKVVELDEDEIERRIQERNDARLAKDFVAADRIRDELLTMGITLKDGSEGTTWQATSDD